MNTNNFSTRTRQNPAGVSKRSLLLLGGFAALALNPEARRRLVGGTRGLIDTAGHTLEDTVKPVLATAAEQAGQVAHTAVQKGAEALETLRDEGPGRAQALLGTVQEAAGTAAGVAATKAADLTQSARQAAHELTAETHHQQQRGCVGIAVLVVLDGDPVHVRRRHGGGEYVGDATMAC